MADTVVAAQPDRSSAAARLGRAALRTEPAGAVASASSSSSASPTSSRPSRIATVAGIAPDARTAASDVRATAMLWGYGRPWLISVDSSATTGRPARQRGGDLGVDLQALGDRHVREGSSRREAGRSVVRARLGAGVTGRSRPVDGLVCIPRKQPRV